MKRVIGSMLIPFVLAGCTAVKQEQMKKDLKEIKVPKPEDFIDRSEPIIKIPISKMVIKQDSLNHNVPKEQIELRVKNSPIYLKDLKLKGYTVYVEKDVAYKQIPPLTLKGDLATVLEQIATLTNTYWSYENGVIVFKKYKTVVYRVPLESVGKLSTVFYSPSEGEGIDFSKVKEDVFDEIEKVAKTILAYKSLKVKGEREIEEKKQKEYKKAILEENKIQKEREKRKTSESNASSGSSVLDTQGKKESSSTTDKLNLKKKSGIDTTKARGKKQSEKVIVDVAGREKQDKSEDSKFAEKSQSKTKESKYKQTFVNGIKNSEKLSEGHKSATVIDNNVKDTEKLQITEETLPPKDRVIVSKDAGLVVALVSRETEKELDLAIKQVVKKMLSTMVMLDVYVLETNFSDVREVSVELSGLLRNKEEETSVAFKDNEMSVVFTSLSQNFLEGIAKGFNISAIASYLTQEGKGKVLSSPKILTLPNHISKISATVRIPYIEPQTISIGGTNPQQTYQIKGVDDGITMTMLPALIGDNSILLAISVKTNRYLGDKQIQAGQLGIIQLPIQSPRILQTSLRVRAGDIFVLGGVKQKAVKRQNNRLYKAFPNTDRYEKSDNTLLILGKVRLIKFVEN